MWQQSTENLIKENTAVHESCSGRMTDGKDAEQSQSRTALAEQGGKNHLPELRLKINK